MRQILNRTALFFVGNLILRSIGFVLLPLYTRHLSPADYGIWGLSNSIGLFLNIALPFGMLMAVGRFYFDARDESERAESLGTIFVFLTVVPLLILLPLEKFGAQIFAFITPGVAYAPTMRLTVWAAYFSMFSIIPLMVLRSREQAGKYLLFNLGQALLFHSIAVTLVVFARLGVLGLLWGNLISSLVFALVYITQTLRWYPPRFSLTRLGAIFRYSLPLFVHGLAGWILMLSDRLILQRWVTLAEVGIYSIGYTLGTIVQNAAEAATNAWFPVFYASRTDGENARQATDAATYLLLAISAIAIALTVGLHHLIGWILPDAYRGAEAVAAWVALSGIFAQVYYILSYSLHYIKKTGYIALISWSAALINLLINFALIPRYGFMVAAISTLTAYMVMAGGAYYFSKKLYPLEYEFNRWRILLIPTIALCLASIFRPTLAVTQDALFSAALLAGWLASLYGLGFLSQRDRAFIKERVHSLNIILRGK